ncbi:GNAT family N-acetyltransferase [Flavobacterium sp. MC2016-06]|uniref:GNAT family N-acetyltransferase n=1 Tax=Flavobacterium sp. MC2016-06 TaxID=2676308 RepID=UPI00209B81AC|nr:GNAT family N-acetyltransferase [Flavobacterium sp. MC2016-06]
MMQIIEPNESHLPVLKKLFLQERQSTFTWVNQAEFKLSDFDRETEGEYLLIALENEVVIGFISVWLPNNFIHHLYIDKQYHGQGIGTKLLNAVTDKIGFPITLKCLENNTQAVHFYRRKGFVQKERGLSGHGGYILFELKEPV